MFLTLPRFCTKARWSHALLLSALFVNGQAAIAQADRTVVSRGLISRYSFDGTLADSSASQSNLSGNAGFGPDRQARANGAILLTGSAALPSAQPLNIVTDFSAACWIRPTRLPGRGRLHAIFSVESTTLFFNLGLSGDSGIGFRFEANGPQPFVNTPIPADLTSNWAHIAVTRDANTCKLFLNGRRVDSVAVSAAPVDGLSNGLLVGGSNLLAMFGVEGFYDGLLDELRFYNRALTRAEIDTLAGNIAVSIKPASKRANPMALVMEAAQFASAYPAANVISLTGAQAQPQALQPGCYIWLVDGQRRRLVIR